MAKQTTVTLDTRVLDAIVRNLGGNVADAVAKAAFAIEARAKVRAPVDTGALRASIYTSLAGGGRSSDAMADARSRNPDVETTPLPVPRDKHTAYVGPSVEYATALEFGSAGRAAQPYLIPAVRETEAEFRKLLGKAVTNGR